MKRSIFYVSDGTGITAETLGHTLLTQFDRVEFSHRTLPFVDTTEKAQTIVDLIDRAAKEDAQRPIVFSTLVNPEIQMQVARSRALMLDLFSVFIRPLELELELGSTHKSGRSHGMVDQASYNFRIDAVNFALRHDDGASTRRYDQADIVLVGVSRSGKTPTCLYLAMQFGIHTANYPMAPEEGDCARLPAILVPFRTKLYGLTIDPERLRQIRSERRPDSQYASLRQCRREVEDVEAMFRRERLAFLDTTSMSIEEIASKIIQQTGLERRLF